MFKNYLKIAWRSLIKHKLYSAIKIGGFAFSIATCFLITLYIRQEVSYDRSYPEVDNIYRMVAQANMGEGNLLKGISFQAPMAETVKANFPEIEEAGRLLPSPLFGAGSSQVSTAGSTESLHEEGFTYADQGFLDIFQFPMVHGELDGALTEPKAIVLTKTKAEKYFPEGNPVGQVLYLNNDKTRPYTVKGVLADIPVNSHFHGYDFFISIKGLESYDGEQSNWLSSNYITYFKVRGDSDSELLANRITHDVLDNYWISAMKTAGAIIPEWFSTVKLLLQPVADIHLYSSDIREYYDANAKGDIRFVWLFGGIAAFILLIACINFINLSTAKSASRAKEVGMRKVVGSDRRTLIAQFLSESMLYSLLAIIIGVLLAWASLPLFNQLSGKELDFPWSNGWLLPVILLATVSIGMLAGLYPAVYLSAFRPIHVLKGQLSRGAKSPVLRNVLVVFQFTASIVLIVGTLIINSQMQFILNSKIGFDKDQVMIIHGTHTLDDQAQTLKDEMLTLPQVQQASVSAYMPVRMGGVKRNGNSFWKEGRVNEDANVPGQYWEIDEAYIPTLGIEIKEGRNFDAHRVTDSAAAIINEKLAATLGLENPVGQRITNGGNPMTIIGVVEDFNFETMRDEVGGLCMVLGKSSNMMALKLDGSDMKETIAAISTQWKKFSPDQALRFTFLDESFARMYEDVQRTGTIFTCFSVLAIIIACLGLFGLAAFMTEQRTKEIGIRKVLGASVSGIVALLSKDFLRLMFIAIVIASPIAWWAMNKWLQDFSYRIEIQWWMFALAGLATIVVAISTVASQAIKAAVANPVDSLRDE